MQLALKSLLPAYSSKKRNDKSVTGIIMEGKMKSILIKDTTKEERIALIKEWIADDDGLQDCDIDLWDMYDDYIKGNREIAEINAAFQTNFYMVEE